MEGMKGIFSHGFMSFAAVTIITACLLITGSFSLLAVNIDFNLNQLMSENEFLAYVDDTYTEDQARELQGQIEAVDNVSNVSFISQSEAMQEYKAEMGADAELYADLPDTVLRHRFAVQVDDIELLSDTIAAVRAVPGIADISAALDVANGFITVRNIVTIVTVVMVAILLIISLFIVSNAIKLATMSRQEEIAIMKMCGATNGFIRMPFIFEGIVLGLTSALLSFLMEWGIYKLLMEAINGTSRFQLVSLLSFSTVAPYVAGAFAFFGLLVGVCGSVVTIRKYLRV